MTFQKNKGFSKQRREKQDGVVHKLKKYDARWYTADWCGYCKLQKKILQKMNPRLLDLVKENDKNVPKNINGFPALYIPGEKLKHIKAVKEDDKGNKLPVIIPGFKNERQLLQIVSQLP